MVSVNVKTSHGPEISCHLANVTFPGKWPPELNRRKKAEKDAAPRNWNSESRPKPTGRNSPRGAPFPQLIIDPVGFKSVALSDENPPQTGELIFRDP